MKASGTQKRIALLVVLLVSLIGGQSVRAQVPVDLNAGFTLIAWPVKPVTMSFKASDLHDQIEEQNGNLNLVLGVTETQGDQWDTWSPNYPAVNNFEIEYGKAYFVQTSAPAIWMAEGEPATPVTLTLATGNNGVGIPFAGIYTAASLAQTINGTIASQGIPGSVTHVRRWDGSQWITHVVGLPFANFMIEPGRGYVLKISGLPVTVSVTLPNTQSLMQMVQNLPLNPGQQNGLLATLQAALNATGNGNLNAACGQLNAFINQVLAFVQTGQISAAAGASLVTQAQAIRNGLGC